MDSSIDLKGKVIVEQTWFAALHIMIIVLASVFVVFLMNVNRVNECYEAGSKSMIIGGFVVVCNPPTELRR